MAAPIPEIMDMTPYNYTEKCTIVSNWIMNIFEPCVLTSGLYAEHYLSPTKWCLITYKPTDVSTAFYFSELLLFLETF
jgi:hypothetical protein